ncbi:hypothetical protein [Myxococcus xanthus]|uniref:hypothetical protein n=1 Tax=Myxococcus xanthus TaxID=34 RepID=UPI001127306D|nr:hypothetical protein [Myxococcus xanthus]
MKKLSLIAMLGLSTALFLGCGGALEDPNLEDVSATPQQEASETNTSIEGDSRTVTASAYGCCAWCWNRERYHLVEGVVSNCTDRARDYCAVAGRGGLFDAAWDYCSP